jgi:hypothetical protein
MPVGTWELQFMSCFTTLVFGFTYSPLLTAYIGGELVAAASRDTYLHSQELKRPAEPSPHSGTYSYKTSWILPSHLCQEAGKAQSLYWIVYALDHLRISDQFPVGARVFILSLVHTGYWAQSALYSMGNEGSFLGEKSLGSEMPLNSK